MGCRCKHAITNLFNFDFGQQKEQEAQDNLENQQKGGVNRLTRDLSLLQVCIKNQQILV